MAVTRRQFMKVSAAGLAASSVGALGFAGAGDALAAGVRPFKLERATETRNACPYCAVACGVLIYSLGDKSKNAKSTIIHIEGDPDHPVNRGTLCPRGAASLGFIHSANRLKYPMHRKPGTDKFERVSWDFALDRIAKLMKEDRDKNFIAKNARWRHGQPLAEHRLLRRLLAQQRGGLPHLQVRACDRDTGVRRPGTNLTRSDGGQSWPHIRTRRDDELVERHQEH